MKHMENQADQGRRGDADARARDNLARLVEQRGSSLAGLSLLIGRNAAYLQQFLHRGTPRRLAEQDRRILAQYFGVAESELGGGAPPREGAASQLVPVRRMAVEASAGPGALAMDDPAAGVMGFDPAYLKSLGVPEKFLSLITVKGDSMEPVLSDGDTIMVDSRSMPVREGIYVLRMDDALMVKRVAPAPGGRLSIRSDNALYPSFPDVAPDAVQLVGRVIWAGRRLG